MYEEMADEVFLSRLYKNNLHLTYSPSRIQQSSMELNLASTASY